MGRWIFLGMLAVGVFAASGCGGESVIGDGVGGTGGSVGATGGTGVGGTGVGGSGAAASSSYGGWGGLDDLSGCLVKEALTKSCARTGCHSSVDHWGGLDFTDPFKVAAQVVDQPAMHGDINCAQPGEPFRPCTLEELEPLCAGSAATSTLLIDSANFENSWVLRKLNGEQGTCGEQMPIPPGNSVSNGWNDARKACLERYFRVISRR